MLPIVMNVSLDATIGYNNSLVDMNVYPNISTHRRLAIVSRPKFHLSRDIIVS